MPAKKKIKTEPPQPQPQPQPLTTPLRDRFLQACINFWNMYVYFCVYRFQENEDCGLATVCTILACESLTRSAALSYWFPSLNVSSMDPGAIETPEGAIDIMVMLVHLHKEGACPLPQGTTSTGDLMTDTLNSTGIMRELLFVIPFFLPFFNYTSYILFSFWCSIIRSVHFWWRYSSRLDHFYPPGCWRTPLFRHPISQVVWSLHDSRCGQPSSVPSRYRHLGISFF